MLISEKAARLAHLFVSGDARLPVVSSAPPVSACSSVFPPSMEGEMYLFRDVTQGSAGGDSAVRESGLIKLALIIHSARATLALSRVIQ